MDPNAGFRPRTLRAAGAPDAPDGQNDTPKPAPRLLVITHREGPGRRLCLLAWLGSE